MKIFDIPIIGKTNQQHLSVVNKLEKYTPKSIWQGIKTIYSTDAESCISGTYITRDKKELESNASLTIIHKDGSLENLKLDNDSLPVIILFGKCKDEYNIAFNLLHEVGHHNDCGKEWEAHRFASQFVNTKLNIFDKKEHITFSGGCKENNKRFRKKLNRQWIIHNNLKLG